MSTRGAYAAFGGRLGTAGPHPARLSLDQGRTLSMCRAGRAQALTSAPPARQDRTRHQVLVGWIVMPDALASALKLAVEINHLSAAGDSRRLQHMLWKP